MKFLCGNCKAKYQIADEKVSGRTLRMKCRRCGHDILIDGHSMASASAAHPAPAQRRGGGTSTVSVLPPGPARPSVAHQAAPRAGTSPGLPRPTVTRSKPPSSLGADFRRHVAAPPEVPQRTAPYDLWHVAIQDVPVGPMTRDELSRKIDAGAVTPESLCWREGMDDWRPLGELPELAGLLRRSREGLRAPRHRPPPEVPSHHGSRASPLPTDVEDEEDGAEPTRISEFQPTQGSVSAPMPVPMSPRTTHTGTLVSPPPAAAQAVSKEAAPAPAAAAPAAQPVKSGRPIGSGLLLTIGLLIGMVIMGLGFLLLRSDPAPQTAAIVETPKVREPAPVEPATVEIKPQEDDEEPQDEPTAQTPRASRSGSSRGARTATPEAKPAAGKALSERDRQLLERAGGGGGGGPDLDLPGGKTGGGASAGGAGLAPALNQQQLTKVVNDNKTQLQRCYETALRAAGGKQEGSIKISVAVVVGSSGTTKSVNTQGDGLGNMTDCIRQSVKRWRFPVSGGDSEFTFPLVFQPGA